MNPQKETEKRQEDLVFNPGSERNIISICLKDTDKILEVESEDIFAEHFGIKGHKWIFNAIMYLYSKKIKATALSIMEVLSSEEARKSVEELGGLEYIMLLEENRIDPDSLKIFIQKVKQSYTRRMLFDIANDLRDFVLSSKSEVLNPAELVSHVETKIHDLNVNTTTSDEVYKMGDDTEAILNDRAERPAQVPGLEVGWTQYDILTQGAQAGDLIIVVAPSKTGKSVTLKSWATKISIKDKLPVLYIDTEMSSREQEDRILADLSGIPQSEIVSGLYVVDTINGTAEDKIKRLKDAREKLQLGNYYHVYMPQFTIEKVSALARKFQAQFGIVALFFDYIKIPSNQANFRDAQEYQRLGFFTSGLKELAGMLKIPVFSAAQATRDELGDGKPSERNIGGSYRILQLASKLMFLYNKTDEQIAKHGAQNGNQQLYIAFQRNGASDCDPINIFFDKPILRQTEV